MGELMEFHGILLLCSLPEGELVYETLATLPRSCS